MAVVRCKHCNSELDKEMLDAKICFNCGEAIDESIVLSTVARQVMGANRENENIQFKEQDGKIVCVYCGKPLYKNTLEEYVCSYCQEYIDTSEMSENVISKILSQTEMEEKRLAEIVEHQKNIKAKNIIVTTGDLKEDYDVIGPVYFQLSNKGIFSSSYDKLYVEYIKEIESLKASGLMSDKQGHIDWGWLLYGEFSAGQNKFEISFYIAVQELKKRARIMGADAIVAMKQDIDLDTNGFAWFYLQMYGTAVKLKEKSD